MDESKLLKLVKTSLRIFSDVLDDGEIVPLIEAAKADISSACEKGFNFEDMTQCNAVVLYVKAHFGNNAEAHEKYAILYEKELAKIAIRSVGG